jgi:hypothetical protein
VDIAQYSKPKVEPKGVSSCAPDGYSVPVHLVIVLHFFT